MIIKINGKSQELKKKFNLTELIESKGLLPESVVVEHNGSIVQRDVWHKVVLEENDKLEIVSFVSGG